MFGIVWTIIGYRHTLGNNATLNKKKLPEEILITTDTNRIHNLYALFNPKLYIIHLNHSCQYNLYTKFMF